MSLGPPESDTSEVTRGANAGLHLLDYEAPPASVFLKDGKVFVIDVIPKEGSDLPIDVSDWERRYGRPERIMPSIRGKNQRVYVYSDKGFALAVDMGRVRAVEFFEPMGADEYERRIYLVPPRFTK